MTTPFGITPSGEAVKLYTISGGAIRAAIHRLRASPSPACCRNCQNANKSCRIGLSTALKNPLDRASSTRFPPCSGTEWQSDMGNAGPLVRRA